MLKDRCFSGSSNGDLCLGAYSLVLRYSPITDSSSNDKNNSPSFQEQQDNESIDRT